MKLLNLKLKNFKGIREFDLIPSGQSVSVYGENARGKTTIVDAFMWLLFNKDSMDHADFSIKILNENGEEIHGLEHQVEALIDHEGKEILLRKIYKEKWTKKRGQTEPEFTGHETEYFVDEVPRKKKEFEDYISGIIPEMIFKLVTNPLYFNSLAWKERREIMLGICGDIGNDKVFEAHQELHHIKALLDERTIEDTLRMLKAQKAKINKELDEIPVRISEVSNATPELPQNYDVAKINAELSGLQEKVIATEKEKSNILKSINDEKVIHYNKITELQKELLLINSSKSTIEIGRKQAEQRADDIRELIEVKKESIERNNQSIRLFEGDLVVLERQTESLRKLWHEADQEKFVAQGDSKICKACGQSLPDELINQKVDKQKVAWDEKKKDELMSIESKGKMAKTQALSYQKNIESCIDNNQRLMREIAEIAETIITNTVIDGAVFDAEIAKINAEIAEIRKEIEKIDYEEILKGIESKIFDKRSSMKELEKSLNLKDVYETNKARIEELKGKQKELSNAYLMLEKNIDGVERFIKAKCDMQENSLNSMFNGVKFKLFSKNINGGIEECFETLVIGVPWSDANAAAKVNSGIEIINKLCEYYKFNCPIFVDCAESITKLQPTDSQVIRLVVSAGDKELRTEINN